MTIREFRGNVAIDPIHLNVALFAREGGGKTRWARSCPNPYFVTFYDKGGQQVQASGADGCEIGTWEDFKAKVIELEAPIRQGRWPYQTLVIDGMSLLSS